MKKTDVYVVVDTPKKAKKLKRLLDMFGERTYSKSSIQDCLDNTENVLGFDEEENAFMSGYVHQFEESRTEVSIKELRNILAKEHLKEGDVVIAKNYNIQHVIEFKKFNGDGRIVGKRHITFYSDLGLEGGVSSIRDRDDTFHDFIRYATEEEKALLEPKKDLIPDDYKDKTWYKRSDNGCLFLLDKSKDTHFGFLNNSQGWSENIKWFSFFTHNSFNIPTTWKEATPQEVEFSLIGEAKRRYKVVFYGFEFDYDKNILFGHYEDSKVVELFKKSKWSEVIDKFAELKEAHRNGAVIQWRREKFGNIIWKDCNENEPAWVDFNEYRIKPEEKPTLTDKDISIVERLHDTLLDNHGYSLESKLLTDARMLANKIKSNIK